MLIWFSHTDSTMVNNRTERQMTKKIYEPHNKQIDTRLTKVVSYAVTSHAQNKYQAIFLQKLTDL
jgi:hypothetical protein